jgi:hypothetical protein
MASGDLKSPERDRKGSCSGEHYRSRSRQAALLAQLQSVPNAITRFSKESKILKDRRKIEQIGGLKVFFPRRLGNPDSFPERGNCSRKIGETRATNTDPVKTRLSLDLLP